MRSEQSNLRRFLPSNNLLLLAVCVICLFGTAYQAVLASRVASVWSSTTLNTNRQALALIGETLPRTEKGEQATALARMMVETIEQQHATLQLAFQGHAKQHFSNAVSWAAASLLALLALVESRRKGKSAA